MLSRNTALSLSVNTLMFSTCSTDNWSRKSIHKEVSSTEKDPRSNVEMRSFFIVIFESILDLFGIWYQFFSLSSYWKTLLYHLGNVVDCNTISIHLLRRVSHTFGACKYTEQMARTVRLHSTVMTNHLVLKNNWQLILTMKYTFPKIIIGLILTLTCSMHW